jgi:hypothetical protein
MSQMPDEGTGDCIQFLVITNSSNSSALIIQPAVERVMAVPYALGNHAEYLSSLEPQLFEAVHDRYL